LELSLAETPKNEDLLIAACHFWSNGVNAFLFGHGPMSPTLADVYMITGLDISGSVHPWDFRGSTRQTRVKPGSGYKFYIQNHMKDGPRSEVEYRAFLNMWLCRFIFCGKANEPTLNHIVMATKLAGGKRIPLGKYLLGSVYHMLHQTITQMHTSQKTSCVNGPWWFVQMWLQLHMHQIIGIDLNNRFFPSSSYHEGEVQVTEGATPMEKLLQLFSSIRMSASSLSSSLKAFPNLSSFLTWTPRWKVSGNNLTLPCQFSFEAGRQNGRFLEIFNIFIHPCILPAEFSGGRLNHSTYEYYQPNMVARQLGCGQMPPRLFLHEFLKLEKKSKTLLNPAGFFSMNAAQPFIPGFSHLPQ
jgi:hypothetical protein